MSDADPIKSKPQTKKITEKENHTELLSENDNSSETSPLPEGTLELSDGPNTIEDDLTVIEEENTLEEKDETAIITRQKSPSIPNTACMDNPIPRSVPKHQLQSTWVLWFMDGDKNKRNDKPKDWRENLTPLYTFDTVEDFWILYGHILNPSKLRVKNDYMLFKEGIKPEWEDPGNKAGGKWQFVLPNKFRQDLLDKCWLKTILSIIAGHYHDLGQLICGAYLQRRQKEDRISLWTSDKDLKLENETIGKQLKKTLAFDSRSELHYLKHEDGKSDGNQNRSWKNRNQHTARLYVV